MFTIVKVAMLISQRNIFDRIQNEEFPVPHIRDPKLSFSELTIHGS